jgi:signal transduction histidine kinase
MIRLIAAWLIGAVVVMANFHAIAADPRRVLLLHSFGRDFAPFSAFAGRFREQLFEQSREPLDVYEESLQTARFRDPNDERPFADYLRVLFEGRKLDLIVAFGASAAQFVQRHRAQLFPATPMLITGVDQRRFPDTALTANDALVALKVDNAGYFDNIMRLLPETTTIAVVIGNTPLERFWVGEMQREFPQRTDRLHFEWLNDLSFDAMLKRVGELPPNSAIFYPMLAIDLDGVPHGQERALARLYAVANAPIFSITDNNFGLGPVGGPLISTEELGRRGAEVAVRILGGTPPNEIKTPALGVGTPLYDGRELQRWGISEARLPPGSVVQFREPNVWARYRWQLAAIAFVWVALVAIVTWLLIERRRRQRAELESRSRLLELIHSNRTIAAGALSASIAHELNQPLGAIMSNAEAAELLLAADPPDLDQLKEILADIRQADHHAAEIIQRVRKLLKRQSDIELHEFDIKDVIAGSMRIVSPEAKKRGIAMNANIRQQPLRVRADQIHLQQVILNLATNAMDAMNAVAPGSRKVTIEAGLNGGAEVQVSVADSGVGIPEANLNGVFDSFFTTKPDGTGLGLSVARTIVETYGGKIWAENAPKGGAIFHFSLPLAKGQSA